MHRERKMQTSSSDLLLCLSLTSTVLYLVSLLAGGQHVDSECAAVYLQIEPTCQPYLQGTETTPSEHCCNSTNDAVSKDPTKCLCFFIHQAHNGVVEFFPDTGAIQEAKLRQLPAACRHLHNATSSIADDCPRLLGLAPNSADVVKFANDSSTMTEKPPTRLEVSYGSSDDRAIFRINVWLCIAVVVLVVCGLLVGVLCS